MYVYQIIGVCEYGFEHASHRDEVVSEPLTADNIRGTLAHLPEVRHADRFTFTDVILVYRGEKLKMKIKEVK